jgi:hypothetical protein
MRGGKDLLEMRFEIIQFIVPLAFLAVWALTALLNRDAQPLPPRPMSGGSLDDLLRRGTAANRVGTSASGPARYLGAGDRVLPPSDQKPGARWSTSESIERPGAERRARAEEGVVILDSESRGTAAGSSISATTSRPARAQSTRRGGRGRSTASSASPKPADAGKPRALSGLVRRSLAEGKARPLEIAPLAAPLVPINVPLAQSVSTSVTASSVPLGGAQNQRTAAMTGADIRSRFASADNLREIAILSEILQPPLAVRGPRRVR